MDTSQSRSRDFIVLRLEGVDLNQKYMSQSRSRDFIVLSLCCWRHGGSPVVTIPFAGFYCSEGTKWEGKVDSGVTIPFAGFYCSEWCCL